jgi:hypothetical protein
LFLLSHLLLSLGNSSDLNETTSLLPKKPPLNSSSSFSPDGEDEANTTAISNSSLLRSRYSRLLLLIPIACVFLVIAWALRSSFPSSQSDVIQLSDGGRVYLKTATGNYLRIESPTGTAVATESIPWITGSTFRVEAGKDGCWLLRSRATGKLLNFDKASQAVEANGDDGSAAVLCFVVSKASSSSSRVAFQSKKSKKWLSWVSSQGSDTLRMVDLPSPSSSQDSNHLFEVKDIPLLQGVNLGGRNPFFPHS